MFSALLAIAILSPDSIPVDITISGEPHSGIFISIFETSLFEPCDSDERWWLEVRDGVNELFWKKVDVLRAEHEQLTDGPLNFGSPPMYLIAKGEVSKLGEYGHMGQYDRRFDVKKFSEFRLSTNKERIRCVTSGFMSSSPVEDE